MPQALHTSLTLRAVAGQLEQGVRLHAAAVEHRKFRHQRLVLAVCEGVKRCDPLRAADGPMSMYRLLTVPARSEASSGSSTRLPLHPTGNLAGRLAP